MKRKTTFQTWRTRFYVRSPLPIAVPVPLNDATCLRADRQLPGGKAARPQPPNEWRICFDNARPGMARQVTGDADHPFLRRSADQIAFARHPMSLDRADALQRIAHRRFMARRQD